MSLSFSNIIKLSAQLRELERKLRELENRLKILEELKDETSLIGGL